MELSEVTSFIQNQKKYCWNLLNEYIQENLTDVQCPPSFDGLLCWPQTAAPGNVTLSCPPYHILGYKYPANSSASKVCLPNGSWYRNQEMIKWSNYSLCIPPDGQYVKGIQDFEIDRPEDEQRNWIIQKKWLPTIKIASQIGYASSFTLLVIAMVVFSLLRRLRNPRNRLHMHLFASFIMRAFMNVLKNSLYVKGVAPAWDLVTIDGKTVMKEHNHWICKGITSLWQYSIVANYVWILMEGLYLHNLVFLTVCSDTSPITIYAILGWVLPMIIVTVWIIVRVIMDDVVCWTTGNNLSSFLITEIPIMVSILVNFILFINVVRVLLLKMKTSAQLQHRTKMQYRRWARSTLLLVPVFGVHYALFSGLSYIKNPFVELVCLFGDQLFVSFQGCFVAFLYCLLNDEVRTEVRRAWQVRKLRREDSLALFHRKLVKPSQQDSKKMQHDYGENVNAAANVSTL